MINQQDPSSTATNIDMAKIVSDMHLILSKNKVVVEFMNRKMKLDIENDKLQKTKEDKYESYIEHFDEMKKDMISYEQKFVEIIHLLRLIKDSMSVGISINNAEIDEKLQDIFKQL